MQICHKYLRNGGCKTIRPKKVIEISKKKLHELFLHLITVSAILRGNTMMNKQRKWSKSLCNEPCVNCPTVQWNTKGTNEARSLIIPGWLLLSLCLKLRAQEKLGYTDGQERASSLTWECHVLPWGLTQNWPSQPSRTVSSLWASGQEEVWNNPQLFPTLKGGAECPQTLPRHPLGCHWCCHKISQ